MQENKTESMKNSNNIKPTTDDSPSHGTVLLDKAEDLIKRGAVKGAKLYWKLLKGMVTEISKMTKEMKKELTPNKGKK